MSYLARRDVVHVRNIRHVRVARERTLIDDLLFADPAPARLLGGIIGIRCRVCKRSRGPTLSRYA
jgi:hypothetical protein